MATKRKLVTVIVIAIVLTILVAVAILALSTSGIASNSLDEELFENPSKLALCFDLRNEDRVLSGLVINATADTTKGQHIVLLPFRSTEAQPNNRLLTTWGAHNAFTIVTYVATDKMGSPNGIGIVPRLPFYSLDEINIGAGSRDFVYIVRAGLERRFIYKYPTPERPIATIPTEAQALVDNLDSIGVAIPANAEFREVRPGFSEVPTNEYSNAGARFYTASQAKAGTDHIELRYAFKATPKQTLSVEFAVGLLVTIAVAYISLQALRPEEVQDPRKRRLLLAGGIFLQILLVAGIIIYIWFTHVPGETELKAIGGGVITVVGEILGAVIIHLKKKS